MERIVFVGTERKMEWGYILEGGLIRLINGLNVGVREKEDIKVDSHMFVLSTRVESKHVLNTKVERKHL